MPIVGKFNKVDDKVAEYEVSIDGQSPVKTGKGEHGRSRASSAVAHYKDKKVSLEKFQKALEMMERMAEEDASFSVEIAPEAGPFFDVTIDGESFFTGYEIDKLIVALAPDQKPTVDPRGPGF
ncbi:hypothetical protein [Rhizobium sp. Rhizsp42]|uniref:hypothetical protein n=1 Tax=Rhizobium sp. Rhizsp42 TaxID=3243034 RepID=UPI0039AFC0AC